MPRIPQYQPGQVRANPIQARQEINIPDGAFGGGIGKALVKAGTGFGDLADDLDKIVLDEADAAAKKADADFASSMRELLHTGEGALYNLRGENAVKAAPAIQEKLQTLRQQAMQNLPEPAAKAFDQVAQKRMQSALDNMATYTAKERETWLSAASDARIAGVVEDAAISYTDRKALGTMRATIRQEVMEQAERGGWAPEVTQQALQKHTSSMHVAVIDRMLVDDPMGAKAYFDGHRNEIDGADVTAVTKSLETATLDARAQGEVRRVLRPLLYGGSDDATTGYVSAVVGAESGGDPAARNPQSTALGLGQFLEGTWMDLVTRNRPDLLQGRDRQQVLALRTDPALAREMVATLAKENAATLKASGVEVNRSTLYLAHFAGPGGAVEIMGAPGDVPASEVLPPAAIEANPFLRDMTIADVRAWAERKVGASVRVSSAAGTDAVDFYAARMEAMKIQDPKLQEATIDRLEALQKLHDDQVKAERKKLEEQAWAAVDKGGTPTDIPPEVRRAIGPEFMSTHWRAVKTRGEMVTDWTVYTDLRRRIAAGETVDVLEYRPQLAAAEYKELVKLQTGDAAERTQVRTANAMVDDAMRSIGLNPNAKAGTKDAEKVALFYRRFEERLSVLEASKGKKASAEEMQREIDRLVVEGAVRDGGWFGDKDARLFEVPADQAGAFFVPREDIPPAEVDAITAALRRAGQQVTDQAVEDLYARAIAQGLKAPPRQ